MKLVPLILNLLIICLKRIKSEPNWSYEILEINVINKVPDIGSINVELVRLSRGHFGFSGNITINQDLTDENIIEGVFFYSVTGSNYIKSPFHMPKMPFSRFINTFYRDLCLDSYKVCSKNAPLIATEDPFVPPLTKRVIEFNKCVISNENMPSILKAGFYKIVFTVKNQADSTVTAIIEVEAN